MQAVRKQIIISLDPLILTPASFDLLRHALAVGDLSCIHRIVQNSHEKASREVADFLIPHPLF